MLTLQEKINDFLAQKSIAIVGVSRKGKGNPANTVYGKLRAKGYRVYAVNPNMTLFEGQPCYPNVKQIPEKIDAAFLNLRPAIAEQVVHECAEAGIKRIWLHRSFGVGSVSQAAIDFCDKNQITLIAGACPMMFCEPVDFGHKCIRWFIKMTGGMPA